jgi:predicted regulator of Ras-like GTPase activity (Roadblock/LC7/MglB family)
MTPRKRKSKKAKLEVEEKPEITIDLPDEPFSDDTVEAPDTADEKPSGKGGNSQADTIEHTITSLKTREGVVGYIWKNSKSASIDLKDPTKIIEYATLSSSTFETSEQLLSLFELGSIDHVIIEGGTAKLLALTQGENQVSVFMEKNIDHKRIHKDLLD